MTNFLLFLILVVLIAQLFDNHKRGEDLSKEDEAVKNATKEVSEAKERLPQNEKPPTKRKSNANI